LPGGWGTGRAAVEVEVVVDIDRAVDVVFAFVATPENASRYSALVLEARRTSIGPMAVGSSAALRCRSLGRAFELHGHVREYVPNRRFALETTAGPCQLQVDVKFEPRGEGTRLTSLVRGRTLGLFRLADSLVRTIAQTQIRDATAALKALLEGEAQLTAEGGLTA
jgi:uncharacterized protein YndB with AHSA1/START domain